MSIPHNALGQEITSDTDQRHDRIPDFDFASQKGIRSSSGIILFAFIQFFTSLSQRRLVFMVAKIFQAGAQRCFKVT